MFCRHYRKKKTSRTRQVNHPKLLGKACQSNKKSRFFCWLNIHPRYIPVAHCLLLQDFGTMHRTYLGQINNTRLKVQEKMWVPENESTLVIWATEKITCLGKIAITKCGGWVPYRLCSFWKWSGIGFGGSLVGYEGSRLAASKWKRQLLTTLKGQLGVPRSQCTHGTYRAKI